MAAYEKLQAMTNDEAACICDALERFLTAPDEREAMRLAAKALRRIVELEAFALYTVLAP